MSKEKAAIKKLLRSAEKVVDPADITGSELRELYDSLAEYMAQSRDVSTLTEYFKTFTEKLRSRTMKEEEECLDRMDVLHSHLSAAGRKLLETICQTLNEKWYG